MRGIDVPGINRVGNYDAPRMAEDYVHRIGRTGRAGRAGIAVTFLGQQDRNLVKNIERFTGNKVTMMEITGLEPRTRFVDNSRVHKPQNNARKTWGGGRPARPTTRHSPRPAGR